MSVHVSLETVSHNKAMLCIIFLNLPAASSDGASCLQLLHRCDCCLSLFINREANDISCLIICEISSEIFHLSCQIHVFRIVGSIPLIV